MTTKAKKKKTTEVPSKLARFETPITVISESVESFDSLSEPDEFESVAEMLLEVKAQAKALSEEYDDDVRVRWCSDDYRATEAQNRTQMPHV